MLTARGFFMALHAFNIPSSEMLAVCSERPPACAFRNSFPRLAMMQSGEDLCDDDSSGSVDGTPAQRVFAQSQMRARVIITGRIRGQHPSQMPFAKDQDKIQAVSPQCPDQPLNIGVLPG